MASAKSQQFCIVKGVREVDSAVFVQAQSLDRWQHIGICNEYLRRQLKSDPTNETGQVPLKRNLPKRTVLIRCEILHPIDERYEAVNRIALNDVIVPKDNFKGAGMVGDIFFTIAKQLTVQLNRIFPDKICQTLNFPQTIRLIQHRGGDESRIRNRSFHQKQST